MAQATRTRPEETGVDERVDQDRTIERERETEPRTTTTKPSGGVAAARDRFGGLDIPVANAGVAPPAATMRAIDPEVFERVVEIDLLGVWRTARACLPQVTERRGHIVVVASVYAFMNPALGGPYAISKAGVEQMGRALRAELAPHGASASVRA